MTDIQELRRLMSEAVSESGHFADDWRWLSSPLDAQEKAVAAAVNALPALLDEVERLQKYEGAWAIARENLLEENGRLRWALLDLLVSLIPMPPYETGKAAQDAWSQNRMNAEERARAALEGKP